MTLLASYIQCSLIVHSLLSSRLVLFVLQYYLLVVNHLSTNFHKLSQLLSHYQISLKCEEIVPMSPPKFTHLNFPMLHAFRLGVSMYRMSFILFSIIRVTSNRCADVTVDLVASNFRVV